MAINLLQNVQNAMNMLGRGDSSVSSASAVESIQSESRLNQRALYTEVLNMLPGSTIQGKLVSIEGNDISLLLSDTLLLKTQVDSDTSMPVGSQMTFQIKSNHDGQLTLRPLFTNTAGTETIMRALDAAGLQATETTIDMVNSLMEEGMPVNKDMLTTISRELAMYPEADVRDIVMLHKMNIPVNSDSVNNMHLYHNNNQYMMESVDNAAGELLDMFMDTKMADAEGINELAARFESVLKPDVLTEQQLPDTEGVNVTEKTIVTENRNATSDTSVISTNTDTHAVTDNVNEELPDINKQNVFKQMVNLDKETLQKPEVKELFRAAIKELLEDNILMKPEEISKDKYVMRYYERIRSVTDDIARILQDTGKADTQFAKTASGMKQNITFMNQVNELYNYVQLPLKMNNGQANGDLYVYAKKRSASKNADDKLTALLHLSMEVLGNMDIFLTLQDGKLSTKFCLEKEENIDFIEAHIDMLNDRLMKKGYNVETYVSAQSDSDTNVIDRIVNEEKVVLLSTQSFDARA